MGGSSGSSTLTGQVGDHPREHRGLLSVGQIYTGHEDHGAGK